MRRHKSRRSSKQGKIIIITSVCLLFIMTAGYAAFSTNINITAKGNVYSKSNIYVSSAGSDETGKGTKDNPYQTISKAYDFAAPETTIYVMDNLTIDESIDFDKDKKITLTSEENEVNSLLRGVEAEDLIRQTAGELTLTNITLDGQNKEVQGPLLATAYGTLKLKDETTIKNNINNHDSGDGIGVGYSTVNIDGAKITNNQALAGGGGGIISNYSNITIESGEISSNISATSSGGESYYGKHLKMILEVHLL